MAPILFTPLQIKSVQLKNRIVVSPMCEYSSENGFANDWHLVHLGSRAIGGAGLVITEATAVSPEGRISPDDLGIWKDEHIEKLKQITDFIHLHGSVAGIQLAHAGRKASVASAWKGGKQILPGSPGGWQTVAPSAIPFAPGDMMPAALSLPELDQCVTDFANAAKRALAAGFKVVEIHAAHGYLVNQFLSPISNIRADEYGGNFENRTRLLLRIVDAVQDEWPATLPLFVRLSVTEWTEGGWTADDSIALGKILKDRGVDLLDCSSGGNVPGAKITIGPGYQVPLSNQVKHGAGILTGAVGMITDAVQAETILQQGEADLIIIARELLRDPYFPLHAAEKLKVDVPWPVQYERAKPKI